MPLKMVTVYTVFKIHVFSIPALLCQLLVHSSGIQECVCAHVGLLRPNELCSFRIKS